MRCATALTPVAATLHNNPAVWGSNQKAIESGNADEAQKLMRNHVNMLGEVVADFIASLAGLPLPVHRARANSGI